MVRLPSCDSHRDVRFVFDLVLPTARHLLVLESSQTMWPSHCPFPQVWLPRLHVHGVYISILRQEMQCQGAWAFFPNTNTNDKKVKMRQVSAYGGQFYRDPRGILLANLRAVANGKPDQMCAYATCTDGLDVTSIQPHFDDYAQTLQKQTSGNRFLTLMSAGQYQKVESLLGLTHRPEEVHAILQEIKQSFRKRAILKRVEDQVMQKMQDLHYELPFEFSSIGEDSKDIGFNQVFCSAVVSPRDWYGEWFRKFV